MGVPRVLQGVSGAFHGLSRGFRAFLGFQGVRERLGEPKGFRGISEGLQKPCNGVAGGCLGFQRRSRGFQGVQGDAARVVSGLE